MSTPRTLANLCETRAKSDTRFDTFRGKGPDQPTRNYVVLYFSPGTVLASDVQSGSQRALRWSFRAICVGLGTDDNCLYVVEKVRLLFKNWSPVSEEFTSWLEEAPDDAPLIRDDEVPGDTRYSLTLRFTLNTRS